MVIIYNEKIDSHFNGTIIDIETIGNFNNNFHDSRKYSNIQPVIFGFINNHELSIYCSKGKQSIEKLKEKIPFIIDKLLKPFHAFNSEFEMGVFFHSLNKIVRIERELNIQTYESKKSVVSLLNISQYDDPFNDDGKLCMEAWLMGQIERAIAHNRSCLLKERDILLKRGFRKSEELNFVYG